MEYPPSSPTDQRLAMYGRQRFAEGLVAGLPDLSNKLKQFVTDLSGQMGTVREMQSRRDSWMSYNGLERDWLQRLQKAWTEAAKAAEQAGTPAVTKPLELSLDGGLSLLSDDVVENKILASRIALTVGEQAGNHFEIAKARTQRLLGRDLSSNDVLRPEAACLHVVDQWIETGLSRADLQLMLDPLQTELAQLLEKQYQLLNKFYEERGVSATTSNDLRARVRRTSPGGVGAGGVAGAPPNSGFDNGPTSMGPGSGFAGGHPHQGYPSGYGMPTGMHFPGQNPTGWMNTGMPQGGHPGAQMTPQMAAQINAQMAAQAQMNAQMSQHMSPHMSPQMVAQMNAQMAAAPYLAPLQRARQRAAAVMVQLRNLLTQPTMNYDMVNAPPASAALVQAMTDYRLPPDTMLVTTPGGMGIPMPQEYTPQVVNQVMGAVREKAADLKKKASTASEKAIIEVVALMFQSILNEDRLPPSIRVWFARLQVPVLRVALAEPDFFSNTTHPARQLIDRMGACVLGFDAATINGTALESEVRRIVQVIEQYPETGSRVFQLVFEEFERFIAKSLAENKGTQKIVGVAQQVEQRETLAVQYTIELRDMLKDMQVRDEIREFLFKNWAEVLAVAAVRNGPQHDETIALKRTAADLVWAASAKPHRSARAQGSASGRDWPHSGPSSRSAALSDCSRSANGGGPMGMGAWAGFAWAPGAGAMAGSMVDAALDGTGACAGTEAVDDAGKAAATEAAAERVAGSGAATPALAVALLVAAVAICSVAVTRSTNGWRGWLNVQAPNSAAAASAPPKAPKPRVVRWCLGVRASAGVAAARMGSNTSSAALSTTARTTWCWPLA